MIKVAYICEPQVGGTYTFFLSLREPLRLRGIDFRCVSPCTAEALAQTRYRDDPGVETSVSPSSTSRLDALIEHLIRNRYDGVMMLPGVYTDLDSLPFRLDPARFVVARLVHSARGVYKPAASIAGAVNGFVAVSDRLADDLVGYGVAPGLVSVIYHGVDHEVFVPPDSLRPPEPLRLLYVGRLEDHQKHVTLLPRILHEVLGRMSLEVTLTLVGEGKDHGAVESLVRELGIQDRVMMDAARERSAMARLFQTHHALLLPSRFEGCGFTLIEAMSCGCVPIVSDLKGIFDRIVVGGESGYLCRVGDASSFADAVLDLASSPDRCVAMAGAARRRVEARFTLGRMADDYARLFHEVAKQPVRTPVPPQRRGSMMTDRLRGWVVRHLPQGIKDRVRTLAERHGKSL
ncbi:MAG TPA: glycosyltransferase family 4 protein [Kiritimatiellia bacterium]|nr:glycosyltransferase family 4 protein [Kiritimatiellia bacterium]